MNLVKFNPISSVNEDLLKVLSHYGPVTCLKIYLNYIIAGYGSILKVFKIDQDRSKLVFSKQMFKRNKIHNIAVSLSGENLVIGGGRSFRVLDFTGLIDGTFLNSREKAINEWIISTQFVDDNNLLILNSHNTVYKIDISTSSTTQEFRLVEKVHCNEKSILYSGSIRILSNGRIVIAAGTVMNGVIIWDMDSRKIIHNLTDHEGSIFGVKVDLTGKYIISCSDDRSVKLYGFEDGKLLASGWGHGSRIWNLAFFQDTSDGLKILSAGEDCTVRIWKYHPNNDLLEQVESWENVHLGKHVWSADLDDTYLKLCISGGADGRIRIHDLQNRGVTEDYSLDLISDQTNIKFNKHEIIKQYFELPQLNLLVILSSQGKCFSFNQLTKKFSVVSLTSDETAKFNNFGVMKGFTNLNLVVICARNGDLLFLKFTSASEQPSKKWMLDEYLGGNKVTNLLSHFNVEQNEYYLLIDCPNPQVPFILKVFKLENDDFKLKKNIQLNQPKQTSFTTTYMTIDYKNSWLILGSRYVSLVIYDLNTDKDILDLSGLFKKLSPGDTITSISSVESFKNSLNILVTVRDGIYMFIEITKRETVFELDIVHQNKLSRGFIEGGFTKDNDLILFGFKSSYFYIWNETKQLEITDELCGGAHRQWELFKYTNINIDYKFVYINKSTLYIKSFKGRFIDDNYGLINNGTHGREIRDVNISPKILEDNSKLIVTASEDTTVKLGKLYANGEIKNYWTLNNHVSGLQKIKFLNDEFIASSAANEEFYIWKLNQLKNNKLPIIVEYARLKPNNVNPDLRIMNFDTFEFNNGFIISMVYSDSNIKLWYFDIPTKSYTLIINDFYTTCCILNVNFIKFSDKTFIMIGATDGHISIWDITDSLTNSGVNKLGKMIIKQQLHQNGIKALLLVKASEFYKIFSGGDDNALILSTLSYQNHELKFETNSFIEDAASSTITSISSSGESTILVTSVDQIIRLWSYENDLLICKSARYTTIADTGCSDTTNFNGDYIAVIGGAGLSSWKV